MFFVLLNLLDSPTVLYALFTENSSTARQLRDNIRSYNNGLMMSFFAADRLSREVRSSSFNIRMILHGQTYHHFDALFLPPILLPSNISVYVHDSYFVSHTESICITVTQLCLDLQQSLTAVLHEVNPYVQGFTSLQEWISDDNEPLDFQTFIHEDRQPQFEYVRRHIVAKPSEVAAVILNAKDGTIG